MNISKFIQKEFGGVINNSTIVLIGDNSDHIDAVCSHYSCNGFQFKEKRVVKKYKWFGKKTFIVIMVARKSFYESALKEVVEKEDYEMAAVLKRKMEEL